MKKLIFAVAVLLSITAHGQNATIDKSGNYVAVHKTAAAGTATGKTFTDSKGVKYPVLLSSTGKLYYMRTSKTTGTQYKAYIKTTP